MPETVSGTYYEMQVCGGTGAGKGWCDTGLLFVQRIYVPPSAQEGLYEKCMYRYKSIEGKAKRAAGGNYRSSKFADRRSSDGRVVERSPAI